MYVGIVGLPACGKTTVFQTLTGSDSHGQRAAGKVSTRIVAVPDARLQVLADMHRARKAGHAGVCRKPATPDA
jgi:ribosome-binding ATPase YchF (GTP1/OBG family)